MKELFLDTKNGKIPIEQALIEKYNLKPGEMSPFTQAQIVDKNGDAPQEPDQSKKESLEGTKGELVNDGIAEIDNALTLSVSEIIDFSQGVDSGNR